MKHKTKENIKTILVWLSIFIVGSLILNFILYPETFSSVIENIKSIVPQNSNVDAIRLVPSQMEEYGYDPEFPAGNIFSNSHKSCATIESMGESNGISNIKQKVCREACGKRNMEYYSYDCEKDLFVCYCVN